MNVLVFDMDGTIADLYGVEGWLDYLRAYDTLPYEVAKPLYDMDALNAIVDTFRAMGWKIVVTTWLSKGSTKEYDKAVREVKVQWLRRYGFPYDEIHAVKYGTTKADCTRKYGGYQVLVDDNKKIREGWKLGDTINANENIIDKLIDLLESEV